ncbi:unnamed protein product [Dovyalis caffra]|uniref:Uncharacterized protein n=1 Tax=Dovyalis caffra TaxID=77055 RepID=A0AAV1S312_9ROSI|nr:unnamed protein product [Dovyalis caffra]
MAEIKILEEAIELISAMEPILMGGMSSNGPLNANLGGLGTDQNELSFIASRSFEIDDYHGFPLADLRVSMPSTMVKFLRLIFNHETGAEDVHFTSTSSHSESVTIVLRTDDLDADNTGNKEPSSQLECSLVKAGVELRI